MPLEEALASCRKCELDADEARRVSHGQSAICQLPTVDRRPRLRLTHDGQLIAIAEPRDDDLKPTVVLPR